MTLIGGLGALAYDYDTFNVYVVNEGRVTKSSRKERALAYRMQSATKPGVRRDLRGPPLTTPERSCSCMCQSYRRCLTSRSF
jgi:hypothetical protein